MLRLSGWLLGKLRRELQSHTGAPNVSAIAITRSQPCGGLVAKSAMTTGRSAAANASAAFASAAGLGAGAAGTRTAPGGAASPRDRAPPPEVLRRSTYRSALDGRSS